MSLSELLVSEGVASAEAVEAAKRIAMLEERSLVAILVESGTVPEDVFADLVARHVRTVVIDLDLGALDEESARAIPEDVARRYLVIGVARGPSSVRVAFADPLDPGAVEAVRDQMETEVEPLVATVSGLLAAIDREYLGSGKRRDTKIIRARGELSNEVTRQMQPPAVPQIESPATERPAPSSGTSPLHRIEQQATIEHRHEALLLALVDAGVLTRSDYIAALRRLKALGDDD